MYYRVVYRIFWNIYLKKYKQLNRILFIYGGGKCRKQEVGLLISDLLDVYKFYNL